MCLHDFSAEPFFALMLLSLGLYSKQLQSIMRYGLKLCKDWAIVRKLSAMCVTHIYGERIGNAIDNNVIFYLLIFQFASINKT